MEEAEPPECPVCLQAYDAVSVIPRVLTCGHTTCEVCLKQLPNPFPNTIRCSICTALVRCPNPPSSLPKNLDLLHFSSTLRSHRSKDRTVPRKDGDDQVPFPFTLKSWSSELSRKWNKWIFPIDCVSIEGEIEEIDDDIISAKASRSYENDYLMSTCCGFREKQALGLVKVGIFLKDTRGSSFLSYSYESKIMTVLSAMGDEKRNHLEKVLNVSLRVNNAGKACGLWCNEDSGCVYIIFKKVDSPKLIDWVGIEKLNDKDKLDADKIRGMAIICMEVCEIFCSLHFEGLVIGYLNLSCLSFDNFGHIYLNLFEVFSAVKGLAMVAQEIQQNVEDDCKRELLDEQFVLISPELLRQHLARRGSDLDGGNFEYEVGYASDVWTVACLMASLLVGNSCIEVLRSFLHASIISLNNEYDFPSVYKNTMGKISSLLDFRLGSEFSFLKEILLRCLDLNPGNRPALTDLWKSLRKIVIKPEFDIGQHLKLEAKNENSGPFMILGDPLWISDEIERDSVGGLLKKDENNELQVEGDVGISVGNFKCIELKAHLDCVTGLVITDGFLFSSSYDKTVKVWSLQNFTCIHSFKGHEHRVMALVSMEGFCVSGDYKGFICIWKVEFPFSESPVVKLDEKTDWRFSGIHAMAISGREYLYTGGGDKSVKAWSLKDYSLSCTMSGHKAIVTSLAVSNGILYSGSRDGTIRLWSLSDHSHIAVLGEDRIGESIPISSIFAEKNLLVAGHENGMIKIWRDDVVMEQKHIHEGSVLSVLKKGRFLFSGGLDRMINMLEMAEEETSDGVESTSLGSISCQSTIIVLVYCEEKLLVAQANGVMKVLMPP